MSDAAPLIGEPLALDLVNTRQADTDLLTTPAALRAWLELQATRFPSARELAEAALTDADLAAVRELREHTASALDHVRYGTRPSTGDLAVINRAQRAAPAIDELVWNGQVVTAVRIRTGPAGARLAGWLAEAAADLLADPGVTKIRQCEADDCVLLFLPAHTRRRWCSAARCGNRVRVARHYQRHRSSGESAG
ncbi:CGNR zinc finger domain-containing protein [Micromonospora sp. NPDC005291]|uniref:CGNR zinc finger domain-containing protein n=1 Tax=Micromonospora sp. NPDC005291 TaxID=3156872 RepID=UPI0033B4B7F8